MAYFTGIFDSGKVSAPAYVKCHDTDTSHSSWRKKYVYTDLRRKKRGYFAELGKQGSSRTKPIALPMSWHHMIPDSKLKIYWNTIVDKGWHDESAAYLALVGVRPPKGPASTSPGTLRRPPRWR